MRIVIATTILCFVLTTEIFAQTVSDYDLQIQTLKNQDDAMIADWKANDPDIKMWERIKAKNEQHRAIVEQMESTRKIRNAAAVMEGKSELTSYGNLDVLVNQEKADVIKP